MKTLSEMRERLLSIESELRAKKMDLEKKK